MALPAKRATGKLKSFDINDPSTWGPSPTPTEAVGKAGYVTPRTNVRPSWSNDPDYRALTSGQTAIRPRTPQEIARREAYDRYEAQRRRRIVGDDVFEAGPLMVDFAFRHLIEEPAKSYKRTFSGENASQYLDPRGGLRPAQRLAGLGEDVINIASVFPGLRAGASVIADATINRYLNKVISGAVEGAAARPVLTRAELARQQAELLRPNVASRMFEANIAGPPAIEPPQGPNTIRLWHTRMGGEPLPENLNPWEEYLGLTTSPERRGGSPQGNLLSSGLYTTESRSMSSTYGASDQSQKIIGYRPTGSYIPSEVQTRMYPQWWKSDYLDINTPIRDIPEFSNPNLFYDPMGRLSGQIKHGPSQASAQDIIDIADLDISRWNLGGKSLEDATILDLINAAPNEAAARAVVMTAQKPIITTGRTRVKYPLFRNPGGAPTKSVQAAKDMPAYLIENDLTQGWETVEGFTPSVLTVRDEMGNVFNVSPKPYTTDTGVNLFPTNTPYVGEDIIKTYPGQNYFDLPVGRNPETGAITKLGEMKSFDIGMAGDAERSAIAAKTREWLVREYGFSPNDQKINDVVDIISKPKQNQVEAFEDIRLAQFKIQQLVETSPRPIAEPIGKDVWWKFLKDEMGYEAIPHPGGVATGSSLGHHQSVVFNAPEKLPAASYVPGVTPRYSSDIVADKMNEYLSQVYRARMTPRPQAVPVRTPTGDFRRPFYAGYIANRLANQYGPGVR